MSEAAAHALVARVLGLTVDPADLLEAVEADAGLRRSVLDLVPVSTIPGFRGGSLEAIVSERVARAKDLCRAIEARVAAEAALSEMKP